MCARYLDGAQERDCEADSGWSLSELGVGYASSWRQEMVHLGMSPMALGTSLAGRFTDLSARRQYLTYPAWTFCLLELVAIAQRAQGID